MITYKVIKEYPGSPKLGEYIVYSTNDFVTQKPERFKDFLQEIKLEDFVEDYNGLKIFEGEVAYLLQDLRIIKTVVNPKFWSTHSDKRLFKTFESAEKHLHSLIKIQIEGKEINGFVELYSVLASPTSTWQYMNTNSLNIFQLKNCKSPNWKFFETEEERKEYVKKNKPFISIRMLEEVFEMACLSENLKFEVIENLEKKRNGIY